MLTKRQQTALQFLMQSSSAQTLNDIAKHCQVSSRTIQNDLRMVEYVASSMGLRLDKKTNSGIRLLDPNHPNWHTLISRVHFVDGKKRSLHLLCLLIRHQRVVLSQIAKELQVSRQTLTRDVNELMTMYHLSNTELQRTTQGLRLKVPETQLRDSITKNWVSKHDREFEQWLNEHDTTTLQNARTWVKYVQEQLQAEFEPSSFLTLSVISALLNYRSQQMPLASNQDVTLPELFVQSGLKLDEDAQVRLIEVIQNLRLAKGHLFNQEEDALATQLMQSLFDALKIQPSLADPAVQGFLMHLRASLKRIQGGTKIDNPMLEDVRVSLGLLYDVVKAQILDFEKMHGLTLSEDEISFIVMHLGVMVQAHVYVNAPIKIAVVCQHGMATSMLLFSRIQALLPSHQILGPYSIHEFQNLSDGNVFDAIITTSALGLPGELVVHPLLTTRDTERIEKTIWNCTYRKQCDILMHTYQVTHQIDLCMKDLLKPHHLQLSPSTRDYRKAIEIAAKPLLEDGVIAPSYVQKMIWAVDTLGPYMVILPKVAFVHAGYDDGVYKNGISCLRLAEPIDFGHGRHVEVQVLFVIASKAKEDTGLLKLVRILENNDNLETLLSTSSQDIILNLRG